MALRERDMVNTPIVELPEPWCSAAVTVVLPTYNEAANLPVIVAALFSLPLNGLRSWWRTTTRPMAPATSPIASPSGTAG